MAEFEAFLAAKRLSTSVVQGFAYGQYDEQAFGPGVLHAANLQAVGLRGIQPCEFRV